MHIFIIVLPMKFNVVGNQNRLLVRFSFVIARRYFISVLFDPTLYDCTITYYKDQEFIYDIKKEELTGFALPDYNVK